MSHTPGSWTVADIDGMQGMFHIPIFADAHRLAEVQPTYNSDLDTFEFTESDHANARLIAAAPDMLEALEKMQALYSDFSRVSFDLVEIRSILQTAIDKAIGGDE